MYCGSVSSWILSIILLIVAVKVQGFWEGSPPLIGLLLTAQTRTPRAAASLNYLATSGSFVWSGCEVAQR